MKYSLESHSYIYVLWNPSYYVEMSQQCKGITRKGKRCLNRTKTGSYCHFHNRFDAKTTSVKTTSVKTKPIDIILTKIESAKVDVVKPEAILVKDKENACHTICPICQEELCKEDNLFTCTECKGDIHTACLSGMYTYECPLCRTDFEHTASTVVVQKIKQNKNRLRQDRLRRHLVTAITNLLRGPMYISEEQLSLALQQL